MNVFRNDEERTGPRQVEKLANEFVIKVAGGKDFLTCLTSIARTLIAE